MNDNKVISIVTSSFNQGRFIEETIKSVLSQRGNFYIDYIIMDGKSTDNTVSIIEKYEKLLREHCREVEIENHRFFVRKDTNFEYCNCLGISFRWVSEKDKGHADGVNKGIQIAFGDIFAFLNSDDIYEKDALKNVLEEFEQANWPDVVYGNSYYIDEVGKIYGLYPLEEATKEMFHRACVLSQPSVFIKMDSVHKFGLFNTKIRNSLDYEYWLRLIFGGAKFHYTRSILGDTRGYNETKTSRNKKSIRLENMALVKHYYGSYSSDWITNLATYISIPGKGLRFGVKLTDIFTKKFLKLYAPLYLKFREREIKDMEKEIFG